MMLFAPDDCFVVEQCTTVFDAVRKKGTEKQFYPDLPDCITDIRYFRKVPKRFGFDKKQLSDSTKVGKTTWSEIRPKFRKPEYKKSDEYVSPVIINNALNFVA